MLEALKGCELSKFSDLLIYSDAPRSVEHIKGVHEVRKLIKNITGFKSVNIVEREENFGLSKSIISGITEAFDYYDDAIIMEDDLICSSAFLRFMNNGLDYFRNHQNVCSIQGYVYPGIPRSFSNGFFLRGADCWGWATWKRAWKSFELNGEKLLEELKRRNLNFEFDFENNYPYTKMLHNQVNGLNDSWAVRWHASNFLDNKLSFYPGISLIKNIGNDGTGSNAANTAIFDTNAEIFDIQYSNKIIVEESSDARKLYIKFFHNLRHTNKSLVKKFNFFYKLLFNIFILAKEKILLILKLSLPPLLSHAIRNILVYVSGNNATHYSGPCQNWKSASQLSGGYEDKLVHAKVFESAKQVEAGLGLYAQDGIVFHTYEYSQSISIGLLMAAANNNGALKALDIGGGMGVSYNKHFPILLGLKSIEWRVVEQLSYIEFVQKNLNFASNPIHYYLTIKEALCEFNPNVIIFSAALQYFEDYESILGQIVNIEPRPIIIIDRLPVSQLSKDIVAIEKVSKKIYTASYPLHILSKEAFLKRFNKKWLMIMNCQTPESMQKLDSGIKFNYEGFIFCPRN